MVTVPKLGILQNSIFKTLKGGNSPTENIVLFQGNAMGYLFATAKMYILRKFNLK